MSKEREAFEGVFPCSTGTVLNEHGRYESQINQQDAIIQNISWVVWQAAKAEAVPEGFGDIQSWIAVNSFSALDASMDDFPVVDANELAKYIDSLIEPKQPSSTSDCPDEP